MVYLTGAGLVFLAGLTLGALVFKVLRDRNKRERRSEPFGSPPPTS